ncbi:MAG: amidohydrolase [Pigmentiphaga sp.]|nr:amidohydrolase [Pigmentiphaga sp.]
MTTTSPSPATSGADLLLMGQVRCLDDAGRQAQAIAIRDGRILDVGSREAMARWRSAETVVHDHGDRTLIPGFNDTHAHLDSIGLVKLRPSLHAADSVEAIVHRVRELAAITPRGEWIVTGPIGQGPFYFDAPAHLRERRLPGRHELDAAAPHHPVCITAPSGYWGQPPCYTALNSAGLALNGIDRDARARVSGVDIERDEHGEPTGIIIDHNYAEAAQLDLLPAVPRFTRDQRLEAIRLAMPVYHSMGTTSVYEGHGMVPLLVGHYRTLHELGQLSMRTGLVLSLPLQDGDDVPRLLRDWCAHARGAGIGDDMLRISGVFLPFGGDPVVASLARQAPEDLGWSSYVKQHATPEQFEALALEAARLNLRVHTVAADNIDKLLTSLERVAAQIPLHGKRWVVEHLATCSPEAVQRLARLGVGVTLIPLFHIWKVSKRYENYTDAQKSYVAPARHLLDAGVPVSTGTDAVPNNPLMAVWSMAARRERRNDQVLGAEGRLEVERGLRLATVAGAWLTFEEHRKGPLLPGYLADIAVLDEDPCQVAIDRIPEIRCAATYVGGRQVYGGSV